MDKRFMFLTTIIVYAIIKTNSVATSDVKKDSCSATVNRIYQSHIEDVTPTELEGEWTSDRCETRPGPEYVVRKYSVYSNNIIQLVQFYYGDSDCTQAMFSVSAHGSWMVNERESLLRPGTYQANYRLYGVSLTPYDKGAARKLHEILNDTCTEQRWSSWHVGQTYKILRFTDVHMDSLIDYDCTASLQLSFNELQLVRVESEIRRKHPYKRLLLGNLHIDRQQRIVYKPTAFQTPMVAADTYKCGICRQIAKSNAVQPPFLHRHRQPLLGLSFASSVLGEWFSERCESRPSSHYLTRRLIFKEPMIWEAYYHYYSDVACRDALYTVYTTGTWSDIGRHNHMPATRKLQFNSQTATLKVEDKRICNDLNNEATARCSIRGSWFVGKQQILSIGNDCPALGIILPNNVHEIAKVERHNNNALLLLGSKSNNEEWPSSFESPLIYCGNYIPRAVQSPNMALTKYDWRPFSSTARLRFASDLIMFLMFSINYIFILQT